MRLITYPVPRNLEIKLRCLWLDICTCLDSCLLAYHRLSALCVCSTIIRFLMRSIVNREELNGGKIHLWTPDVNANRDSFH